MGYFATTFFKLLVTLELISYSFGQSVPTQYSSYRPNAYCNPSQYFQYPTTISDVVAIVQYAMANNLTVKAVGARHSQTDVICTEGIPIDAHGLKFYQINPDGTATLGAGVTLHEATEFLRQNNLAFKTTPAFGNITLGGAVGTGAHGSSIKYKSSISSQVVGLTIVDGFGNVQNITEEADLHSFRIHLGLLGIVVRVTLATQPLYKTLAHNYIVSDEVLTNGTAQQWAQQADQMSLYWFPTYNQVVVANWTIVDVTTPGDASTNDHVPSTYDNFNILASQGFEQFMAMTQSSCPAVSTQGYNFINILQKYTETTLVNYTPDFVPIYEENGIFKNPAVGFYDKMFAPTCIDGQGSLQCLWGHGQVNANITILDNEITLALSDMPQFIASIKDIITKSPCLFPLQGVLMRFSAASTTYMSTAYGRDSVHFEFYLFHRKNQTADATASLAAFQTIMQVLAYQYGGRSHWGKSGLVYQSTPMLGLKLDPVARSSFIAAMNKFDPNGVFINNFGRRIRGNSTALDIDPTAVHCALLDNCFCSVDKDCAAYQTCTTVTGYPYPVCQTNGVVPISLSSNVTLPNPSLLAWLSNTLPTLNALVTTTLNSLPCLLHG